MSSTWRTSKTSLLTAVACCGLLLTGAARAQVRDLEFVKDPASKAPQGVAIPRSYALVIGVSRYPKLVEKAQLLFPERDATEVYTTLISAEGGNFQNVRRLTGARATLANIRRELEEWLPSVTRDDDRILVFFAGHGFLYGGKAYLAPYDFDPSNITGTGYSMEKLGQIFGSKIKGKWKVLLTDACHSGAITPDNAAAFNSQIAGVNPSLFSFTASRDREQSFEDARWGGGHGVFTYYVNKGMAGEADASGDGVVTADELADYVRRNVREQTGNLQTPTSDRGSFDSNMLLAYVPTRVKPGPRPAPKEGTLVFVSQMDGVEVFIDGRSQGVVNSTAPLELSGLTPGVKLVKAVRMGYEPDGPREEMVYPGQKTTVTLRPLVPAKKKKAAVDRFDEGLEEYNKGNADAYRRAVAKFRDALTIEPRYGRAAMYLGRSYNALLDEPNAQKYLQLAVEIDPDSVEARTALGGMLFDIGNVDEAIRQLNQAVRRDATYFQAYYLLTQAFRIREQYPQAIESGRQAVKLAAHNAEAHFWFAEALRRSKAFEEARKEYLEYLRLSDFDSKFGAKLNYYVGGFIYGRAKKSRAAQVDIWKETHSMAHLGICDCEQQLKRFDSAIQHCRKALTYDREDPYTHYALGLVFAHKGNQSQWQDDFATARKHFQDMLAINSDIEEAKYARANIAQIEALLQSVK